MRRIASTTIIAFIILPMAVLGCKGKVEKTQEEPKMEMVSTDTQSDTQAMSQAPITEPAQNVATETIPPSATPPIAAQQAAPVKQEKINKADKDKDIQKALKNAGFYAGAIDGKIGPKTIRAIEEFQKAKGLKADGKVGPKTWAELEKYLVQQ